MSMKLRLAGMAAGVVFVLALVLLHFVPIKTDVGGVVDVEKANQRLNSDSAMTCEAYMETLQYRVISNGWSKYNETKARFNHDSKLRGLCLGSAAVETTIRLYLL